MIGGAGKKIGTMVELAEDLYERVTAVHEQLQSTTETVEDTAERVEELEAELDAQRALLEAVAEGQGVDVESVGESSQGSPGEAGDADKPADTEDAAAREGATTE